jgi:hypothetical protein
VGIPLTHSDYHLGFREKVLDSIYGALKGIDAVEYSVFINPPTTETGLRGIVQATNTLVEKCLAEKWDYLWIVEGDIEVPDDAFRKLFLLADINLGIYPNHRDDKLSMMAGYFRIRPGGNPPVVVSVNDKANLEGRVFKGMVCAGVGCALIKRRVFEKGLRFVYDPDLFRTKVGVHDQLFLFEAQRLFGFKVFLHGDVICGHLPEWPLPKSGKLEILDPRDVFVNIKKRCLDG